MVKLVKKSSFEYHIADGENVLAWCIQDLEGQWHTANRLGGPLKVEPQAVLEHCIDAYLEAVAKAAAFSIAAEDASARLVASAYDIINNRNEKEGYIHRLEWGLWRFVLYQRNDEKQLELESEFDADSALTPAELLNKYHELRKNFPFDPVEITPA